MIFRGFIIGSIWTVGNIVLDIPIFHYQYNLVILLYCILISVIQFLIMRSGKRSFTASVWFVSMPFAILMFILLKNTSFSEFIHKFAFQKYWNQWTESYDISPGEGFLILAYYMLYYMTTFISAIVAIILSKPKK